MFQEDEEDNASILGSILGATPAEVKPRGMNRSQLLRDKVLLSHSRPPLCFAHDHVRVAE